MTFSLAPPMPPESRSGLGAAYARVAREARQSLLRERSKEGAAVSNLELFFDLVFVFAVTQLSHTLLAHFDWVGAAQTAVLFFAVWWAWMYTTWATNWIDPDRAPNRLAIGGVMIASLLMACAVPYAFGDKAAVFVGAYLAVQIGRSLYTSYAMGEWKGHNNYNLLRIAIWFAVSAIPWIAGVLAADPAVRMAWWIGALGIEYAGPYTFFPIPGLGRSRAEDWTISGSHMAERCSLFIIIALGEGLIISGATYAVAPPQPGLTEALFAAFLGSFVTWWIYFDLGAKRGAEHIENHENPGLIARQAFTYWHIPIVGGIILLAVTDELVLLHPLAAADPRFVWVLCGGMALFLWGAMTFKKISSGQPWYPLSHGVGLALTATVALWGLLGRPPLLALSAAGTLAFATVALWEWGSFHGGWIERMERRGWWLGTALRRRGERLRARREAREATKASG